MDNMMKKENGRHVEWERQTWGNSKEEKMKKIVTILRLCPYFKDIYIYIESNDIITVVKKEV